MAIAQDTVLALGIEHQQAARLYAMLASAVASHAVLSTEFNWRQSTVYDPVLAAQLATAEVSAGQLPVIKNLVANSVRTILSKRLVDGSSAFADFKPADSSPENVGRYQLTPGQVSVHYPQVASASGFYLTSKDIDAFTAKMTAFKLDDPEYAAQLQQTYWLGSATSPNRTEYDTGSARFWAQGDGTSTLAGFWVSAAIALLPESTPLLVQARFLKLLTTSFWDTSVACWRIKFRELFWRPITAISTAHGARPADPSWSPLLSTPTDPEYISSHTATTGAALYLFESHFGANVPFSAASLSAPDLGTRTWPSFRQAALEVGWSRVFAGVHLRKSNDDGMALGATIAKRIHSRFFKSSSLEDVF
ncbi:hypothetical protein PLESTB_001749300 [Pleodorina starrii]|uniref:Phosphatidic acid phosphatase type 2/haloperoxidase domain-containing protein n=1 Tax=Pleodorina starrii TaxID=330485 RepID=A0A9W6BZX3_9CHLO|nr:hypothetical protein PLESTB_001749300 [Pleodorina starrii]